MQLTLDGDIVEEVKEEKIKSASISPFDFVNAIQFTKEQLVCDEWSEKQYNAFLVNKSLSFGSDTAIQANEMNSRPHLGKKMQFDFLINTVRARKRFNKWIKADKIDNLEVVKTYYKYNTEKALQAMAILSSEQIQQLKDKMFTGGLKNGT